MFLLTTVWICDNIIVEILRQALNSITTQLQIKTLKSSFINPIVEIKNNYMRKW